MSMTYTGRDRNATTACHPIPDERCYYNDFDLRRVEPFASFALFTMSISAPFTTL